MGDSPPVSSRPYTLALKHHQWVQDEIETLECAGVITKSMSPWASPIVVVPKKSQHGEPPKKRLCIVFCFSGRTVVLVKCRISSFVVFNSVYYS